MNGFRVFVVVALLFIAGIQAAGFGIQFADYRRAAAARERREAEERYGEKLRRTLGNP